MKKTVKSARDVKSVSFVVFEWRHRAVPRLAGAVSLAAVILSGCAEEEVILPGKREDLRALPAEFAAREVSEDSRAINLPGQTRNKSWAQPFGTEAFRTTHPALGSNVTLAWSAPIGAGDGKRVRITADPVVGGGRVYAMDSGARVTAISNGGGQLWSVDLKPATEKDGESTGGGISYDDETLYVSIGYGRLIALDAASGAVKWQQQLNATGSGTPTVRGGLVYVVAGDDTGWAVDAKDGKIAWQLQASESISNVLGAPAPVLTEDLSIFAFGSGDLIATFRRGGLRRWNSNVSGGRVGSAASRIADITGFPVISGNRIFVGNSSGRTVALDLGNGDRLWTAREGAVGPVWPIGDSVFAVTERQRLVRFDASDGSVIWSADLPGFVKDKPRKRAAVFAHYGPVVAGGQVIVASNDGLLRFYDPVDGALRGTVAIPGGASTGPVVADGTLYVVSARGQLHAFR
jgi:outer membrane protein assembly factor BamB